MCQNPKCPGYNMERTKDLYPDMPGRSKTWVSLFKLMLKHCGISHSSAIIGSDSPQSNWGILHSFIHSFHVGDMMSNILLPVVQGSTTANISDWTDARAALALLLIGRIRVGCWQSPQRYMEAAACLGYNRCRLVLPYYTLQHATDGSYISNDSFQGSDKYYA